MSWMQEYREKIKDVKKEGDDWEEELEIQESKWVALTEILDDYDEMITKLKCCDTCMYKRNEHDRTEGYIYNYCEQSCKNKNKWKMGVLKNIKQ